MEFKFKRFFSLGSGPVRSLAQKEKIFEEIKYKDKSKKTSVILEVDKFPPEEIVKKIATDCKRLNQKIYIYSYTNNLHMWNIQVVARVLEVAIHKIHEIKVSTKSDCSWFGFAPLPPIAKRFCYRYG